MSQLPFGLHHNCKLTAHCSWYLLNKQQVLPISAARFSAFRGHTVPFAVTAFADTLFASSGLFNTILFALTRPRLMPQRRLRDIQSLPRSPTSPTALMTKYRWSPNDNIDRNNGGFAAMELGRYRFHDSPSGLPPPLPTF